MIRKITLLFLAFTGLMAEAGAQQCGFDLKHQQMIAADPTYAQKVQQMNTQLSGMIASNSNALIVNTPNGPVYQIPVVIHVIHTGGSIGSNYNPSDAQLANMIAYLNQTFSATYPGYPSSSNGGTYIPVQFALAQRTPQCTPTNGIIRVNGSSITNYVSAGVDNGSGLGAADATVKAASIWPNTQYYNIWIVNKIDGQDGYSSGTFTAGYAYFPGAPANVDGTVMLASQSLAGNTTLPHEIGHAFSLYHTFEGDAGGSTCPTDNNCATDGDQVCDTDPHRRSLFNCPTGTNTCTNAPYGNVVRNFMDYSNCPDRFTNGQSTRLLNALSSTIRSSLISSTGAVPIPSNPLPTVCTPNNITNPGTNSGIWEVSIADASLTYMSVKSAGYSGDGNAFYVDNTCAHQVELTAGNIYNFSVRTGPTAEKGKVFVDYNNDGIFQGNEEVHSFTGNGAYQTHSFQYTIPTTTTIPDLVSCVPLRMRVISDRLTAPGIVACPPTLGWGQVEDYTLIIRGGGPTSGSVSVSLTSGSNPSCFNSLLAFTALPGAGLTPASYLWYVNGNTTGVTASTYSSSALANGDLVSVKMFFNGPCGSDSSTSVNYQVLRATTVPADVNIAVTSGTNPGCPGQTLTLTANPVNGGPSPDYQWKVNGNPVGTNSNTYSAIFNNNDIVTVDILSNSNCAVPSTATSQPLTIQYLYNVQNITVSLSSGTLPACTGKPLTFTATVTNAGATPQYQWMINGAAVPGATNSSFTATSLANNDIVTAASSVTDPCILNPADTSSPLVIVLLPADTPHINIAVSQGSNPGCLDSLLELTATVTKHGSLPGMTWLVNGIPVAAGPVFASNTLLNGDVVTFRSTATDMACYTSDTALSTPVLIIRSATPAAPTISLIGNMLVSNSGSTLQWYGPNGTEIPGATGNSYHPTEPGTYYAVVSNNGCQSAASNVLNIALLDIATYDMSQVRIYPNPSEGMVFLDWGSNNADVSIDVYSPYGQGLLHEVLKNGSRKHINLSHFSNGNYFIVIRDNEGNIGSTKIMISR